MEKISHTLLEDVVAILTGVLIISVGVALFSQAELVTGGITGLAFLLHYGTGLGFGWWFFALNLPFYWLAWRRMGCAFTFKTFCAVALLAAMSEMQPQWLQLHSVHPAYAAITGGLLLGIGMLVLFRHRCSLGGLGIAALYAQQRWGWRAGWVLMVLDALILSNAFWVADIQRAMWSILAAAALNLALTMNHRSDRYIAG